MQVLVRMRGTENVGAEWADIQAAVEEVKAHEVQFWKSLAVLFSPRYWKLALASVAIPFFQQFTGMVCIAHSWWSLQPQLFATRGMSICPILLHDLLPSIRSLICACGVFAERHHVLRCVASFPQPCFRSGSRCVLDS